MRIISGLYRGKKLKLPNTESIRPTQDRFKGSIFNMIEHHYKENLKDGMVLDLFAGAGSLGIECLSRGAKHVVFVDKSKEALLLVKENVKSVSCLDKSTLINADAKEVNLEKLGIQFSLVFLDPPYESDLIAESMQGLLKQKVFTRGCIFVTESSKSVVLQGLNLEISKTMGGHWLKIYKLL